MPVVHEQTRFWEPFTLYGVEELNRRTRRLSEAGVALADLAFFGFAPGLLPGVRYTSIPGAIPANGQIVTPMAVVYPEYRDRGGVDELLPRGGFSFTKHLAEVAHANKLLQDIDLSSWSHAFIWRDGKYVMTDLWSTRLDSDQYPQTTIQVFRGLDEIDPVSEGMGHVGAETMFAMGLEEQYRRRIIQRGSTIAHFLERNRENMPDYPDDYIAYTRLRRR